MAEFDVDNITGLVDTAVKTAETGYMQRRLVKVMFEVHLVTSIFCMVARHWRTCVYIMMAQFVMLTRPLCNLSTEGMGLNQHPWRELNGRWSLNVY